MPITLRNLLDAKSMLSFDAVRSAATYRWRKALTEARWTPEGQPRHGVQQLSALAGAVRSPRPRWPERWTTLGTIRYVHPTERGARLEADQGTLGITLFASDLVRVDYCPKNAPAAATRVPYAILKPLDAWPVPDFVVTQDADAYLLQTADMVVGVHVSTGRLFLATADGTLLRADIDAGWGNSGALRHRVTLAKDERLLGLGERTTPHDRRGRTHILWNTDPAGYKDGDDPINLNIPVMVSAIPQDDGTTASHLVFYENPYYAEFDLGNTAHDIAEHRFAGGELRCYLAVGPLPTLLERYTELTGRHSLQPLWMLGYQQSRWSYDTDARVRKLAQDFRDRKVPCDVIHLDIDYMDGFRCFTWNRENFPHPAAMASELRDDGFKLISIIDPGIKQDPDYDVYRQGIEGRHFCTQPDGRPFHAPVWPGDSAFPDFTSAETRAWWGKLYQPLLEAGIAGFWNDMNEPAAFAQKGDRTLPANLQHAMEGRGGTHDEAHNLYGMLMARATREGLEALQPETRPVVITRAGWAGVQRYATSWTADNESTWEALRLTLPMMLGLGLSGIGFTGPDIGGFIGEPDGELFTRWVQMAAFMPFFRAHTAKGYPDQEPWSYGEPYLSIIRRFIELRYELLPYLYTATWQMSTRGWPMVRPLAWAAPDVPALWDVDDAFLCGDKLLIAPVMEPGAAERWVTLPPGTWYEFWSNEYHEGGGRIAQFGSLEIMPLLVRGGTVLTMGEIGASVEQREDKFLRLNVYPLGQPGEATTELYEDAGTGLAYQRGEQRLSRFVLRQSDTGITIEWDREGAYEPPYEHIALAICGLRRVPKAIRADGKACTVLQTDPVLHTVLLGVPIFEELEIIL